MRKPHVHIPIGFVGREVYNDVCERNDFPLFRVRKPSEVLHALIKRPVVISSGDEFEGIFFPQRGDINFLFVKGMCNVKEAIRRYNCEYDDPDYYRRIFDDAVREDGEKLVIEYKQSPGSRMGERWQSGKDDFTFRRKNRGLVLTRFSVYRNSYDLYDFFENDPIRLPPDKIKIRGVLDIQGNL